MKCYRRILIKKAISYTKERYLGKFRILGRSSQAGEIGRKPLLSHKTKRRITTNLKTKNNQNYQKIKLHASPTTKELKKHSPRLVGAAETKGRKLRCIGRQQGKAADCTGSPTFAYR